MQATACRNNVEPWSGSNEGPAKKLVGCGAAQGSTRAPRAPRAPFGSILFFCCIFLRAPVWYPGARSDISGRRHRPCRGYFEVTSPSPPLFSHLSSTPCAFSPLFPYHISLCLSGASRRAVTCLTLATAGALPVAVNFNIAAPLLASSCTRCVLPPYVPRH